MESVTTNNQPTMKDNLELRLEGANLAESMTDINPTSNPSTTKWQGKQPL